MQSNNRVLSFVVVGCSAAAVPSAAQCLLVTISWWKPSHTSSTSTVSGVPSAHGNWSRATSSHFAATHNCCAKKTTRLHSPPANTHTQTTQLLMTSSFRVLPATTTTMTSTPRPVNQISVWMSKPKLYRWNNGISCDASYCNLFAWNFE